MFINYEQKQNKITALGIGWMTRDFGLKGDM
jgi:hypothetical protein